MVDIRVDRRLYFDAAGRLVEDGDPAAVTLWQGAGAVVEAAEAERVGYHPSGEPPPVGSGELSVQAPPRTGKGSGRAAWAAYAEASGVDVDPDATRDDIIDLVDI